MEPRWNRTGIGQKYRRNNAGIRRKFRWNRGRKTDRTLQEIEGNPDGTGQE
jgi:hypothetical protein